MDKPQLNRIVVIPSDPLDALKKGGCDWLERYFNPSQIGKEIFCVSPYEKGESKAFGMNVIGVTKRNFRSVIAEIRPDVVRAYSAFYPAELACLNKMPGIPTLVSIHDTVNISPAVAFADMVICMSGAAAREAMNRGVDKARIRIMPNRVDRDVFRHVSGTSALRTAYTDLSRGGGGDKLILHVGRKTKQKNLDTVLHSLTHLPTEYHCLFIGRGDTPRYQKIAEQLGVRHRTYWLDSVKNSELPNYYSMCDCMCTPSRWEGFGIVFIEAAACEAGIVTSDIAPMNEYLKHDENAYLVKQYESPEAVAAGIRKVCEDKEYRSRIGSNARVMTEQFDLHRIDAVEADLYRESLTITPHPRIPGMHDRLYWYLLKKCRKIKRKWLN